MYAQLLKTKTETDVRYGVQLDHEIRHLYLYAKYYYKKSDNVIEDLKKVFKPLVGPGIDRQGVLYWLCKEVHKYLDCCDTFIDFISPMLTPDHVMCTLFKTEKRTTEEIFIDKCLSLLRFQPNNKIRVLLGEPDPNVLPVKDERLTDERNSC